MAKIICHHNGKYNIYHTVSDCFIFSEGIALKDLEKYFLHHEGLNGFNKLPPRLKRARKNGTSELGLGGEKPDLEGTLLCNRAGKGEANLTTEECINRFLS